MFVTKCTPTHLLSVNRARNHFFTAKNMLSQQGLSFRLPGRPFRFGVLAALFLALANAASYSPTPLYGQERLDTWESVNRGLDLKDLERTSWAEHDGNVFLAGRTDRGEQIYQLVQDEFGDRWEALTSQAFRYGTVRLVPAGSHGLFAVDDEKLLQVNVGWKNYTHIESPVHNGQKALLGTSWFNARTGKLLFEDFCPTDERCRGEQPQAPPRIWSFDPQTLQFALLSDGAGISDVVVDHLTSIRQTADGSVWVSGSVMRDAPCPAAGKPAGMLYRLLPGAASFEDVSHDDFCYSPCFPAGTGPTSTCEPSSKYAKTLEIRNQAADVFVVGKHQSGIRQWHEATSSQPAHWGARQVVLSYPGYQSVVWTEDFWVGFGGRQLRTENAWAARWRLPRLTEQKSFGSSHDFYRCKNVQEPFSPDGGRTFFAKVYTGYRDGDRPDGCWWGERTTYRGIHRLVVDECKPERNVNARPSLGTYLGSKQGYSSWVRAAAFGSDAKTLYVAGSMGPIASVGHSDVFPLATNTLPGTAGDTHQPSQISRFDQNANLNAVAHFGNSSIWDMDTDASSGRVFAVVEHAGLVALSADLSTAQWKSCDASESSPVCSCAPDGSDKTNGNGCRVAVSEQGKYVALLSAGHQVRVFNGETGAIVAAFRVPGHSYVEDIAISQEHNLVYVVGFDNEFNGGVPVQIAFAHAYPLEGNSAAEDAGAATWTRFNFAPSDVGLDMADTRLLRVTLGKNGLLYVAGESAGGNTIFRYDGLATETQAARNGAKLNRMLRVIDLHSAAYSMTDAHVTYVARMNPASGDISAAQLLMSRLGAPKFESNTHRVYSLYADEAGLVYISGAASAHIASREWMQVDGQRLGAYDGSDGVIAVWDSNFRSRVYWTPLNGGGDNRAAGKGAFALGSAHTVVAVINSDYGKLATTPDAYQAVGQNDDKSSSKGVYDAYVAFLPAPSMDYSQCNPFDFREPAPAVRSAKFAPNEKDILVTFDVPTDRATTVAVAKNRFPCSAVLFDVSKLGGAPRCVWVEDALLRVEPSYDATVQERDPLQIKGGVVFAANGRSMSSTSRVPIQPAFGVRAAVAALRCPAPKVSHCSDAWIDARQSEGGSERTPLVFSYTLVAPAPDSSPKARALAAFVAGKSSSAFRVPSAMMVPGEQHRFRVRVVNDADSADADKFTSVHVDETECSYLKSASMFPDVVVQAAKDTPVISGAPVRVNVDARWPECDAPRPLAYAWAVQVTDARAEGDRHADIVAADAAVARRTANTKGPSLFFPADTLFAGRSYVFSVRVSFTGADATNRAVSTDPAEYIEVQRSFSPRWRPLVAAIRGGSAGQRPAASAGAHRQVRAADAFTIDGSLSYDPDFRTDPRPLVYEWGCVDYLHEDRDCELLKGSLQSMPGQGSARLAVPQATLRDLSSHEFKLRVSKRASGDDPRPRLAEDWVRVNVGSSTTPVVQIETPSAVNEHERTKFRARAFSQNTPLTFRWSLAEEGLPADAALTSSQLTRPFISVQPGTLRAGRTYEAVCEATDSVPSTGAGTLQFVVNTPPLPVAADPPSVSPASGVEFDTLFSVYCGGWEDVAGDSPFTFVAFMKDHAGEWVPLNAPGTSPTITKLLPMAHGGGALQLRCQVEDARGARATHDLQVSVSEHPTIIERLFEVFRDGDHLLNLEVFPAALRRLASAEAARCRATPAVCGGARRALAAGGAAVQASEDADASVAAHAAAALARFRSAYSASSHDDPAAVVASMALTSSLADLAGTDSRTPQEQGSQLVAQSLATVGSGPGSAASLLPQDAGSSNRTLAQLARTLLAAAPGLRAALAAAASSPAQQRRLLALLRRAVPQAAALLASHGATLARELACGETASFPRVGAQLLAGHVQGDAAPQWPWAAHDESADASLFVFKGFRSDVDLADAAAALASAGVDAASVRGLFGDDDTCNSVSAAAMPAAQVYAEEERVAAGAFAPLGSQLSLRMSGPTGVPLRPAAPLRVAVTFNLEQLQAARVAAGLGRLAAPSAGAARALQAVTAEGLQCQVQLEGEWSADGCALAQAVSLQSTGSMTAQCDCSVSGVVSVGVVATGADGGGDIGNGNAAGDDSGLSGGAAAGIAVGAVLVIAAVAFLGVAYHRRALCFAQQQAPPAAASGDQKAIRVSPREDSTDSAVEMGALRSPSSRMATYASPIGAPGVPPPAGAAGAPAAPAGRKSLRAQFKPDQARK